jgi:alkylated DNA repair dioxygenase AlkB
MAPSPTAHPAPAPHGVPDGLRYVPDFLSAAEQAELVGRVDPLEFGEVRMHGVVARRSVLHFGVDYAYDARALGPAPPLPGWLAALRARAAGLTGLEPERFAEALVTRYPPGAGIGWHRDAPAFGPVVVGVSLLAPCTLRFRRARAGAREEHRLELAPGSAYVLAGAARASWQHDIRPVRALRYSITFRTLRAAAP